MSGPPFWRSATGKVVLCQLLAYLAFAAYVISSLREPCNGSGGEGSDAGGNSLGVVAPPSSKTVSSTSMRRGPDKLHLLHHWERKGGAQATCEERRLRGTAPKTPLAFAREFFVSGAEVELPGASGAMKFNRTAELMRANRITATNNPCSAFAFVVEDERHADPLRILHDEIGVDMRVYWSPGGTSLDRIFLAARMVSLSVDPQGGTGGLFVTSTADVALPSLEGRLERACAVGLARGRNRPALFVASRRDVFLNDEDTCQIYSRDGRCVFPRIKTCEIYKDKYASWDVFIGRTTLVTDSVLDRTWFSPSFWGAENVAARVLVGNAADVYNLCPHVDVVHFHNVPRKGNSRARIFIRGVDGKASNAIQQTEGDIATVCDVDELSKLERLEEEYSWS